MGKTVKIVKGIAFSLLYVAIYYVTAIVIYAAFFQWKTMEGFSLSEAQEQLQNNTYTLTIVIWLVSMLIYVLVGKLRKNPISTSIKREKSPLILFAVAIAFALGCRLLVAVYYSLAESIPVLSDSIKGAEESLPNPETATQLKLALLCIVVVAPYFEEILFRGLIMEELLKIMKPWIAIILQAIVFGAIHGVLFQSIFAFFVGIALGFVYLRTKNIRLSTFFHGVFNLSSVIVQGNMPVSGLVIYSVAGVLLCGLSIFYICVHTKKDSGV